MQSQIKLAANASLISKVPPKFAVLFNSMLILATENKLIFSFSFLTYCRSYGPIHVLPGLNNTIMFGWDLHSLATSLVTPVQLLVNPHI